MCSLVITDGSLDTSCWWFLTNDFKCVVPPRNNRNSQGSVSVIRLTSPFSYRCLSYKNILRSTSSQISRNMTETFGWTTSILSQLISYKYQWHVNIIFYDTPKAVRQFMQLWCTRYMVYADLLHTLHFLSLFWKWAAKTKPGIDLMWKAIWWPACWSKLNALIRFVLKKSLVFWKKSWFNCV